MNLQHTINIFFSLLKCTIKYDYRRGCFIRCTFKNALSISCSSVELVTWIQIQIRHVLVVLAVLFLIFTHSSIFMFGSPIIFILTPLTPKMFGLPIKTIMNQLDIHHVRVRLDWTSLNLNRIILLNPTIGYLRIISNFCLLTIHLILYPVSSNSD